MQLMTQMSSMKFMRRFSHGEGPCVVVAVVPGLSGILPECLPLCFRPSRANLKRLKPSSGRASGQASPRRRDRLFTQYGHDASHR